MKLRASLAAVLACAVAVLVGGAAPALSAAPVSPIISASETYYRLDVPTGSMTARVEITMQNSGKDTSVVPLWAMPAATHVVVKQGDTQLEIKIQALGDQEGIPTLVVATLPKPLKGATRTSLTMTYDVPAQTSELVRIEPGVTEALFVSQGRGSFVFVDAPASGENYFEPGCLRATDQPKEVKEAGLERWVCGDVTIIAINTEDKGVQKRCADLDDKCRQRLEGSPFSAFVQSITDTSKRGVMEADVPMARGPVKLTLRYFRTDQAWAEKQFAVAKAAIPKLEALFNFNYPRDTITLLQSHFIELVGAAGVAFPDEGEMLITNTGSIDEEVTVHELAHQWAGRNLQTSWLWEGLAEYGMRTLAPEMKIAPRDLHWQSFGYTDELSTWWDGSGIMNPYYWYGKAGAFWFEYEKAVGGQEKMRAVLGQMDDDPKRLPLDGRWFMDAGEALSGAKLDDLFLKWVWVPESAGATLKERRAAHDLTDALTARAAAAGLSGMPTDITANLSSWTFRPVAGQVTKANGLLDAYASVQAAAKEAGLPEAPGVAKAWGTLTMDGTASVIEDQRQAIEAIVSASATLANEPADSPSLKDVAAAREKYAAGEFSEAERLASSSTTSLFNQAASAKTIALAKATGTGYKPSFFGRIGLYMANPEGDLRAAEDAYGQGDYAKALKLSRSAYDTWDGADDRGLMRLAIAAGLMCALSTGVWWGLRRLDPKNAGSVAGAGHSLGDDHGPRWKDWENN